jgi:predicted MPP superfamily phosphohydrolase
MALGVAVLEDGKLRLERSGDAITVVGVQDPSFNVDPTLTDDEEILSAKLTVLVSEADGYTVLLSHRPELFEVYAAHGVDLVFSGHAHGGQFRLPLVGGVVAPNQGLFPKYDAGLFSEGQTHMVVSRGIGNSIIPVRVNNRPEVVLLELEADSGVVGGKAQK